MNYEIYLLPFFISFAIALSLLIILILLGRKKINLDVRVSKRHLHQKGILRFGGIALIVSFIVTIFLNNSLVISAPLVGVLFGSIAILILGFIDDITQLSWKTQLFFQLVIVMAVYIIGIQLKYMTNPLGGIIVMHSGIGHVIGLIISIVWVLFIMNAMNWVDGIDGVAGGITIISMLTIFFLSLRPEVNQPAVGIIAIIVIGALLAFVFLNFHPAKIIAGTSGSMFMGFVLAVMAIFAGAKIATTLLVLIIPITDALWVIGERFRAGDSIFSSDRRHLHLRLWQLGWPTKKICLFYYAITAIVAFISLNVGVVGKIGTFLLVAMVMIGVLSLISRKVSLVEKQK